MIITFKWVENLNEGLWLFFFLIYNLHLLQHNSTIYFYKNLWTALGKAESLENSLNLIAAAKNVGKLMIAGASYAALIIS